MKRHLIYKNARSGMLQVNVEYFKFNSAILSSSLGEYKLQHRLRVNINVFVLMCDILSDQVLLLCY